MSGSYSRPTNASLSQTLLTLTLTTTTSLLLLQMTNAYGAMFLRISTIISRILGTGCDVTGQYSTVLFRRDQL